MATKPQIKIIHCLIHALGIDDDTYRTMLAGYRATSSKNLSFSKAKEIINTLEKRAIQVGVWTKKKGRFEELGYRPCMALPAQLRKIEALWMQVSRQKTVAEKRRALNVFLENRFKIARIEWLPDTLVPKVLKALTVMQNYE